MSNYVITGTSRGIGLELVKQMLDLPPTQVSRIFAVTRNNTSTALNDLIKTSNGRVHNIIIPELTDEESVRKGLAEVESELHGAGLDVLINNAGIPSYSPEGMQSVTRSNLLEVLDTNLVSIQVVTAAALPLLREGREKKVIQISSSVGSIANAEKTSDLPVHAYKISKAAVNMLTMQYAAEYKDEGFVFTVVSPGWLKTDMGSQDADLEVPVGVNAVKEIVLKAGRETNGKFMNILVPGWENAPGRNQYDGKEVPW